MKDNRNDRAIERNYTQKWRFLIAEYELVKAKSASSSASSRTSMPSTASAVRPSPSTTTATASPATPTPAFPPSAAHGAPVYGVQFGRRAPHPTRFANLRSEIFWELRRLTNARLIALPPDEILQAELLSLRYDVTSSGQVKLESKRAIRKKGMPSPDRADALALAFMRPPSLQIWTGYEPFLRSRAPAGVPYAPLPPTRRTTRTATPPTTTMTMMTARSATPPTMTITAPRPRTRAPDPPLPIRDLCITQFQSAIPFNSSKY